LKRRGISLGSLSGALRSPDDIELPMPKDFGGLKNARGKAGGSGRIAI
jgi:hypothetical protein